MNLEYVKPMEIEKRSFEIIESELGDRIIPEEIRPIVMRCIHTSADFDYYDNLYFSEGVVELAKKLIRSGAVFVTDTNMAKAGINKTRKAPCNIRCGKCTYSSCKNMRTCRQRKIPPLTGHRYACGLCECGAVQGNADSIGDTVHCSKGKKGRQQCCCCGLQCALIYAWQRRK